jgi:hypothetical protein
MASTTAALSTAGQNRQFAGEVLEGLSVRTPLQAGIHRPPRHHIFPQESREWFEARGFNIDRVTVELDQGTHSALHTMGWNPKIMDQLIAKETELGRKLTTREIWEIGYRQMRQYDINDLPIVPFVD